jgi:hypothetical protein
VSISSLGCIVETPPLTSGYKMAFLELKIVLSVLLPTFRFEPGSEDVVWHLGATIAPFVQGKDGASDRGPELPLRLSCIGTS